MYAISLYICPDLCNSKLAGIIFTSRALRLDQRHPTPDLYNTSIMSGQAMLLGIDRYQPHQDIHRIYSISTPVEGSSVYLYVFIWFYVDPSGGK